jgi:hypothetical protein
MRKPLKEFGPITLIALIIRGRLWMRQILVKIIRGHFINSLPFLKWIFSKSYTVN